MRPLRVLACLLLALPLGVARVQAQPSTRMLVLDLDAALVDDDHAGALFNVDLQSSDPTVMPETEAAANAGAPFQRTFGLAISPIDGRAYVADLGLDSVPPIVVVPKIVAIDGATGDIEIIAQGAPLVQPFGLAFMPDGRLLIADAEADPSFLPPMAGCGGGNGAIFVIDTATCTAPCVPQVLSDGSINTLPSAPPSAFGSPVGVAYDPLADRIYVADDCASEPGYNGSVFQVNPATGGVALLSSTADFGSLATLDVRPDGTPLVVDQGEIGDSGVWAIDVSNPDPEANATLLTAGTQYSQVEDVSIDAAGRVYLVDSGEYDFDTNTYLVSPAIWYVDETDTNPLTNGRKINESAALTTPIACAIVPLPMATAVTPPIVISPANVIIQGEGLFPSLLLDLGYAAAVSFVDYAPGYARGTAIQALITPSGQHVVPIGCDGLVDLTLEHPFGGRSVLVDALSIPGNTGGIVPRRPGSDKGDANVDGLVDGIDLALLGLHYGTEYCDGLAFLNDADFNNDDLIDGNDLAILATYFGARP